MKSEFSIIAFHTKHADTSWPLRRKYSQNSLATVITPLPNSLNETPAPGSPLTRISSDSRRVAIEMLAAGEELKLVEAGNHAAAPTDNR
jgi:hypothetical protein